MQPCKDVLSNVFKRLTFGKTPISIFEAASDVDIEGMWLEIKRIDEAIQRNDTTKSKISSRNDLKDFLTTHCKAR